MKYGTHNLLLSLKYFNDSMNVDINQAMNDYVKVSQLPTANTPKKVDPKRLFTIFF